MHCPPMSTDAFILPLPTRSPEPWPSTRSSDRSAVGSCWPPPPLAAQAHHRGNCHERPKIRPRLLTGSKTRAETTHLPRPQATMTISQLSRVDDMTSASRQCSTRPNQTASEACPATRRSRPPARGWLYRGRLASHSCLPSARPRPRPRPRPKIPSSRLPALLAAPPSSGRDRLRLLPLPPTLARLP